MSLRTRPSSGVLDFFCHRSGLEDALRDERARGKAAAVDFVRAPPDCTVGQALEAWQNATPNGCRDPAALMTYYQEKLLAAGVIREDTCLAHRAWIVGAPREEGFGV